MGQLIDGLDNEALAALAAAVTGVGMRAYGQRRDQRARKAAMDAERQRQAGLQQQADAAMARSMASATPQAQAQAVEAAQPKIEQAVAARSAGNAPEYGGVSAAQPEVVQSEMSRQMADAARRSAAKDKASAGLRAFGDAQMQTNFAMDRGARDLQTIGQHSVMSGNVLPYELDQANQAGTVARRLSDVSGGLSDIAQMYYLQRKKPRFAKPTYPEPPKEAQPLIDMHRWGY